MFKTIYVLLAVLLLPAVPVSAQQPSEAQLIRKRYESKVTGKAREYYVFLPRGHGDDPAKTWPMILFLHGGGERGNGLDDLRKVLVHGPLMEAWIQRRDLPFVMVVPQAPYPDDRANTTDIPAGFVERPDPAADPPPRVEQEFDATPIPQDWGALRDRSGNPVINAWVGIGDELVQMVESTATAYRVDRSRVYLTGLSMGGFGSFGIAAAHPDLFAAVAPICGGGDPAALDALAKSQRPIWVFHGGRDRVVSPIESLQMVNALLEKGHRDVKFTVHEDLGHNVWTRIYAGEDFYAWLLAQSRP